MRADMFLVRHGYALSRKQAQDAIAARQVTADGVPIVKSSQTLADGAQIAFKPAHPYVSRGALKLVAALDRFSLSARGRICLDIGASTGGFTEVLLARGAARVYAVDVGHGQMDAKLASDPRVILREGINARDLSHNEIPEAIDAIAADMSFISLKLALPPALGLARKGAWIVTLVKPQFEVGRAKVGKGGIVRDAGAREAAVSAIAEWLPQSGWTVDGTMESPFPGGSGNLEYLLVAHRR